MMIWGSRLDLPVWIPCHVWPSLSCHKYRRFSHPHLRLLYFPRHDNNHEVPYCHVPLSSSMLCRFVFVVFLEGTIPTIISFIPNFKNVIVIVIIYMRVWLQKIVFLHTRHPRTFTSYYQKNKRNLHNNNFIFRIFQLKDSLICSQ